MHGLALVSSLCRAFMSMSGATPAALCNRNAESQPASVEGERVTERYIVTASSNPCVINALRLALGSHRSRQPSTTALAPVCTALDAMKSLDELGV